MVHHIRKHIPLLSGYLCLLYFHQESGCSLALVHPTAILLLVAHRMTRDGLQMNPGMLHIPCIPIYPAGIWEFPSQPQYRDRIIGRIIGPFQFQGKGHAGQQEIRSLNDIDSRDCVHRIADKSVQSIKEKILDKAALQIKVLFTQSRTHPIYAGVNKTAQKCLNEMVSEGTSFNT